MGFEDLEVWKRSVRLSADIYKHFKDLKDYGFRDQITRSGLSIASNIAEGERITSFEDLKTRGFGQRKEDSQEDRFQLKDVKGLKQARSETEPYKRMAVAGG